MKEYDEATLKKVQQTEMEILRDFIKVCDENNLTWFGDAGSGIGAIRHKGFIPWDDDIDVMLPRKDFDKMIEVIKRDYPSYIGNYTGKIVDGQSTNPVKYNWKKIE